MKDSEGPEGPGVSPIMAQTYIHMANIHMKLAQSELEDMLSILESAHECAVADIETTVEIVELQGDLAALHELVDDQITKLVRKLAQVDAGTWGLSRRLFASGQLRS